MINILIVLAFLLVSFYSIVAFVLVNAFMFIKFIDWYEQRRIKSGKPSIIG